MLHRIFSKSYHLSRTQEVINQFREQPGCIVRNSPEWFASMGTEKSKGHGIFSVSGHVNNPGQFEAPFGITMRELIEMAKGASNWPGLFT